MAGKELVPSYLSNKALNVLYKKGRNPETGEVVEPAISKVKPIERGMPKTDVTFIAVMPDDSGSIREEGNEGKIIFSHNRVIEALNEIKDDDWAEWSKIRFRTEYLNGDILNNWVRLDEVRELIGGNDVKENDDDIIKDLHEKGWIAKDKGDKGNYRADKGTPLFDRTVELLLSIMLQQAIVRRKSGTQSRFGILIMSDAEEVHSIRNSAEDVHILVTEMQERSDPEKPDVIAFLGVPRRNVDYRKIASEMGIYDEVREGKKIKRVLTPDDDLDDLRHAVDIFSRSSMGKL